MALIGTENLQITRNTKSLVDGHYTTIATVIDVRAANVQPLNGKEMLLFKDSNTLGRKVKVYSQVELLEDDIVVRVDIEPTESYRVMAVENWAAFGTETSVNVLHYKSYMTWERSL